MKKLWTIALIVSALALGSRADTFSPVTFSLSWGQYAFSGMGEPSFLSGEESEIPSGILSFNLGLELKIERIAVSALMTKAYNDAQFSPSLQIMCFSRPAGSSAFVSYTWNNDWLKETGWDFNEGSFVSRDIDLVNIDVGYRLEFKRLAMIQGNVGIAKGLESEVMSVPMPTFGIRVLFPLWDDDSQAPEFR